MAPWTLVGTHPTQDRTFQRPLDTFELGFLWEGFFSGSTDSIHHFELHLNDGSRGASLFSDANIIRAWLSTKRRYPLSGATLHCDNVPLGAHLRDFKVVRDLIPGPAQVYFVVREHDLTVLRPNEVIFEQVSCSEEVQQRVAAILVGPRQLSDELLVQLYVFRETASGRSDVLHLATLMPHCVMDGMANRTFVRCLLDTLARGAGPEPVQVPLQERLATVLPIPDLEHMHLRSLSPAIRRWRRVVGSLIFQSRMNRYQGGHTLPCHFTSSTTRNPSQSGLVYTLFTQTQSFSVLSNCRLNNITFGNAYLPLAQVAMTRVLYRRYLRGEISEEEWDYRKKQPHINFTPFNLRPYLDKAWFENGGGGEFICSVSCCLHQLPFMTLGAMVSREDDSERFLSDGAPPFPDLLTFDRFLHRAGLIKKQSTEFLHHPLLFEIASAAINSSDVQRSRLAALEWMKQVKTNVGSSDAPGNADKEEVLADKDRPVVFAHSGSSLGNMDSIFPSEYPLPPSNPLSPYSHLPHPAKAGHVVPPPSGLSICDADTTPKVVLEDWSTRLHTRSGGIHLGALTWRGRLKIYAHYDGNVYQEGVMREWMEELKEAVLWYLERTHSPR